MTSLSKVFPRWVNRLPLLLVFAGGGGFLGAVGFVSYYGSPKYTDVGYAPVQPVPYSHRQHAGDYGVNCRYCHFAAERSPVAGIPPTQTCLNCHTVLKPQSDQLAKVRESWAQGTPMSWVRVHKLPDFVHFFHNAHLNKGVGCVSCHGRIDQMVRVRQEQPLSMSWCLECHRHPEQFVRPVDKVTVMDYVAADLGEGSRLVRENKIKPPENCSACHY